MKLQKSAGAKIIWRLTWARESTWTHVATANWCWLSVGGLSLPSLGLSTGLLGRPHSMAASFPQGKAPGEPGWSTSLFVTLWSNFWSHPAVLVYSTLIQWEGSTKWHDHWGEHRVGTILEAGCHTLQEALCPIVWLILGIGYLEKPGPALAVKSLPASAGDTRLQVWSLG